MTSGVLTRSFPASRTASAQPARPLALPEPPPLPREPPAQRLRPLGVPLVEKPERERVLPFAVSGDGEVVQDVPADRGVLVLAQRALDGLDVLAPLPQLLAVDRLDGVG